MGADRATSGIHRHRAHEVERPAPVGPTTRPPQGLGSAGCPDQPLTRDRTKAAALGVPVSPGRGQCGGLERRPLRSKG